MAIRWDKFTVKAQEAVQRANDLASEHGNPELLPLHLLAALLEDKEGIVSPVLEKIGIGPQAVLTDIYREIEKLPKVSGGAAQATLSTPPTSCWSSASRKLDNFKDEYVSTEHLLSRHYQLKRDAAQEILARHGATHDAILKALTSSADRKKSPIRIPKQSIRRSNAMPATLLSRPGAASSIPSLAATKKSAAWSRCFPAARKIIPC